MTRDEPGFLIEFDAPGSGLDPIEVTWPHVPRVGDTVDVGDPEAVDDSGFAGRVKDVQWWRDGRHVRVVVEIIDLNEVLGGQAVQVPWSLGTRAPEKP